MRRRDIPFVLDIHEIARGSHRAEALHHRACWLRLCRACHEAIGDASAWPVAAQLALKKVHDPQWYDRELVNRVRGRAPESITEEEVDVWVEKLRDMGVLQRPAERRS